MSGKDEAPAPSERSAAVKRLYAVVSEKHVLRREGQPASADPGVPTEGGSATKQVAQGARRGSLKK